MKKHIYDTRQAINVVNTLTVKIPALVTAFIKLLT